MGFRYRKSINLGGGFSVNISKNGIGYSWGTNGYRITKIANGRTRQTVSIPGTGISYVDEHGSNRSAANKKNVEAQNPLEQYYNIQTIPQVQADTLRSGSYDELFKHIKIAKAIRIFAVIVTLLSASSHILFYIMGLLTAILFYLSRINVEYNFDDYSQQQWIQLSSAWKSVAASKSLELVTLTAKSKRKKVTAGIETACDTVKIMSSQKLPWYLKTNIKPIVFQSKGQKIAIMPDRLLIFTGSKIGALAYNDLQIVVDAVGMVQQGACPSDSEIVAHVWGYANADGSPDKRYANNKQFPVANFGRITITSASGLNTQILFSKSSAADALYNALRNNPS